MPSRAEKRREKQRGSKTFLKRWSAIQISEWIIGFSVLLLIVSLPWYYGSVEWRSQYVLAWVGVFFCVCIALHSVLSMANKAGDLSVPWLTWLFFLLGFIVFIQSIPMFSWQGNEPTVPSVQVQRWALGLSKAPPYVAGTMLASKSTSLNQESAPAIPCDLKSVPESERSLAWSVEPLHTRGAVASLLLCGLFVWVGRMVFSDSKKQLWLFGTLTVIGILIGCVGIQGAVSYQRENFLGLVSGSSFATFVSKNSAGGYYNICIAGCLGLLGWTLLNTQRTSKDNRYRFPDTNILSRIRGFAEDSLADLNTAQITAVLCLISIVAALLISLCRGAAVSALGAIIIASLIANAKNRSRGSWIVSVVVVTAFVACMVGFQIDDKAYARLESLSEMNLDEEFRVGRTYIWSIAWKAMGFYGLLGSGLGTFHFAYLPFQEPSSPGWFYHAESLYAQCGVELGYIGLSVMILAIIKILSGLQLPAAKDNWGLAFPSKLAGTYLVVSQSLHSFVDFAIIIPALFIPASVLIGSVQGTLHKAEIAPVRKRSRSDSTDTVPTVIPKRTPWIRNGVFGMLIATACGFGISHSSKAIQSLAASEAMEAWTKAEDKLTYDSKKKDRVTEMAALWANDIALLKVNPTAMRSFADSLVFNYRIAQMNANPPAIDWNFTTPLLLRLALEREKDQLIRDQIIESFGGTNAIKLLEKSADWYALGQTKSPLDWRLLWGRCSTNTVCKQNELAKLLPASMAVGKHNAHQLLASAILFRDQFDQNQFDHVLAQAMKSDPGVASNSAKLLALERADEDVSILIFPQRYDILKMIATDAFTKDLFPRTNQLLWERAQKLIESAPLTKSRKELWLAESSKSLGDVNGEIKHLRLAAEAEPNNIKLHCRLAKRLIDLIDAEIVLDMSNNVPNEPKLISDRLWRLDPTDPDVKALKDRIKNRVSEIQ
ncbi:MAG TPA: O-antigen ligase family protein [Pirellula sp.]|nr:O-antigen ligase family protein [Pirellula sp.]